MPLIYLSFAWVAGIYLGASFCPHWAILATGLVPLPLLFWFRHHKKLVILASLCILAFFGGALHYQSSLPDIGERSLQFYNDREVVITGMVDADPEVSDKTAQVRLRATGIQLDGEWHEVSGKVLLFVPRYPTYSYGDVLKVSGRMETPPQLDDFDYRDYLAHQGIHSTVQYPQIEILDSGKGFKPLEWVYSLRNRLSQVLAEALPEPQASLAQGIVLGMRGNIPDALSDSFARTGTAHVLAVSGLHLGILAGMLLSIGAWLFGKRRHTYIWLALAAVWLYAMITGMNPPVVSAAIMASLFLAAGLLGRQRSGFTALAFAAAVMVAASPQILWQASFLLSFASMTGIILISPRLQDWGRDKVTRTLGEDGVAVSLAKLVIDSFSVTTGALVAVLPLIAYYFGIVSLVAPLATLFALPALPAIIVTGALAGGAGLIALPLARFIGWFAWLFLSYLGLVVNVFDALPLASVQTRIGISIVWGYYAVLSLAVLYFHRRQAAAELLSRLRYGIIGAMSRLRMKWIIPPLLVAAILVSVAAVTMPDDRLHVSFLDVGQGDAILIRRGSQQVLVDGGSSPRAIGLALGKEMPFWDRTIELVVLTHPHADHLTGLIEVLERYDVEQVLYPPLDSESPLYEEWQSLLENTRYATAQAGQQIDLGNGVTIDVLNPQYPPLTGTESDIDNNSVVLRLNTGRVSFLLTGDISWEAEFELISSRADLSSTVLKIAHHGSDTSTTAGFLAAVNPRAAVISVGGDNTFGHPSLEVIARLEERPGTHNVYRTDKQGTIEFVTDGETLWARVEK